MPNASKFAIFHLDRSGYCNFGDEVVANNANEALEIFSEQRKLSGHVLKSGSAIAISHERKDLWPDAQGRIRRQAFELCSNNGREVLPNPW